MAVTITQNIHYCKISIFLIGNTLHVVHTKSLDQLEHDPSNVDIALDSERFFHLKIGYSDCQLPGAIHKSSIGHHLEAVSVKSVIQKVTRLIHMQ